MQQKAHELGYHLITPYRKNLKNIRIGEIVNRDEIEILKWEDTREK